jgi:hypothetical protein
MKSVMMAMGLAVLGAAGCGSTTDGNGSEISNSGGASGSGSGGTAGTGFVPVGIGGGSTGAGGAGGTSSAGTGGSIGVSGAPSNGGDGANAGVGGSPVIHVGGAGGATAGMGGGPSLGSPGFPSGPVEACFGAGCPKGECDVNGIFTDTPCAPSYPSDVGPSSTYCNAAETASYCLQAGAGFGTFSAVTCASGTASIMVCTSGCIIPNGGPAVCY